MSDAPFPTKQQIADFLRDAGGKAGKREIARAFKLDADQKRTLKRVLREMKEDGELAQGRGRSLHEPGTLPKVTVIEISGVDLDGEVMAVPVNWDGAGSPPKIYVQPATESGPAPGVGERVLAQLRERRGMYEAKVIRRLGAAKDDVLGIVTEAEGELRIRPVEKKDRYDYVVDGTAADIDRKSLRPGDLVRAEGSGRPRLGLKRARVLEILGDSSGAHAISLISVHQHDIPVAFPEDAARQAKNAKAAPLGKRDDLRTVPLVTIDGADARDFDDAVHAEPDDDPKNEGGYKLMVAIADVAWYVRPGDALDRAAFERGNSVYFPDRVVPMLPEELSNGWCSLRPGEDRPCVVAHLRIDSDGNLLSKRFKRAMMHSKARLTYEQVQAAHDGQADEMTAPLMDEVIKPLYGAFEILDRARTARGALEIDMPERRAVLDDKGRILGIEARQRLDSHKLIEEFMILANVAAAEFLEEKKKPCMYRVHDEPSMSKIEALTEVLESVHIRFDKGQVVTPARFNTILAKVKGTPNAPMINEVVLRSQAQATYDPVNIGHFGLALRKYCHFTSPIRRYSDLLVHRALITQLTPKDGALPDDPGDFSKIGEHLSVTERRAQAAERDAADRYAAHFLKDRVGGVFMGRISGVSRFGLFVALDEVGADGLIPIKTLPDDYYIHDEAHHTLTGRKNGLKFRLGDSLEVRLREATPITGGLLFEVLGAAAAAPPPRSKKAHKAARKAKSAAKPKGKSRASRRKQRERQSQAEKPGRKRS